MNTSVLSMIEVTTTVVGATALLAVIYATVRSKLPAATIQIQTDSIAALEKQNDLLKENVSALNSLVAELRARVSVLETIPLTNMTSSLTALTASMDELVDIGHTNQALMQSLAAQSQPVH